MNLARKWRPQTFEDLIGQAHISITLKNAISADRVHQGYLFTGTRGIGKTSSARIFAKALRCNQKTQTGEPCNQCKDCTEISESRAVDVQEIDGASNNGVDAVREIRENAKYLPSSGKYKIYIIDEVHMLSTAAFNALLKILEEPPAHVVFIFATTDPQKIPLTVLSRCHRFDFRRVSEKDLNQYLKKICLAEKLEIEESALIILTREADGSLRDGNSLLDQAATIANGKPISEKLLIDALGLIDKKTVLDCVRGVLEKKPVDALKAVNQVFWHGHDLKRFALEVLRYLRMVMVAKLIEQAKVSAAQYLDVSETDLNDIRELLDLRSQDNLDFLFRILNHGIEEMSRSTMPKLILDVLVIKLSLTTDFFAVEQVQSLIPSEKFSLPEKKSPEKRVAAIDIDLNEWKKIISLIKVHKPLIGSALEHIVFEYSKLEGERLVITLGYQKENSFYKDQLSMQNNREQIIDFFKNYLGRPIHFEYKESQTGGKKSMIVLEEEQRLNDADEKKRLILESEPFKAAEKLLGAKLEKLVLLQ